MRGWVDLGMLRYILLLLFIGLAWGQVEENIVLDISYYEDGQKKHQRPYSNSIADGKWTHWYENGQKWIEGSYKNNKRNGKWTFYNEDGTVYEVQEY